MRTSTPPLTPAALPAGWHPYVDPTWPPDGAAIDVLHPDGSMTAGCRYRHWDLIAVPPVGWLLQRKVVGWRTSEQLSPHSPACYVDGLTHPEVSAVRSLLPALLGLSCVALFVACGGGKPAGGSGPEQSGEKAAPPSDTQIWRAWVILEQQKDPKWKPPVFDDPREIAGVHHCRFGFRVIQVIDEGNQLVAVGGETIWLEARLSDVVDGRDYQLDGLFKPAGRRQYDTAVGGTRTVQVIRHIGDVPDTPTPQAETKPDPQPGPKTNRVTLTPPKGGVIVLAQTKYGVTEGPKRPDLRADWVRAKTAVMLDRPTEVEVVSRDEKEGTARVKLNGKEWLADLTVVPAEEK